VTSPQALILIDFQKAIDDPKWGRRGQPQAEDAAGRLLAHWRDRQWPILHVRHDSREANSPYRPGTPGHGFKPALRPQGSEEVVAKTTNSAFIGTDLVERLTRLGAKRLVVVGVLLENSVEATVRMAGNLGYQVSVPEEAVASIDRIDRNGRRWPAEDVHALTLAILDGEYCRVTTVDALLTQTAT
jgi:nicotinamidase-related amidase